MLCFILRQGTAVIFKESYRLRAPRHTASIFRLKHLNNPKIEVNEVEPSLISMQINPSFIGKQIACEVQHHLSISLTVGKAAREVQRPSQDSPPNAIFKPNPN
jgi:hypothetical protein